MTAKGTFMWAALMGSTVLVAGACKKSSGGGTGSTGGGGAWLVGEGGLMANLRPDGTLGADYETGTSGDLHAITCREADTAFVVGADGAFLRTFDGGATWETVDLGTTRALADVAAGAGTVLVAGDGVLEASYDSGDSWLALPGNGTAAWRSVAMDVASDAAVLARLDGSIWRWDAARGTLDEMTQLPGARAIAMSRDGAHAVAVGDYGAMARSDNGGMTWERVATGTDADLYAAWATGGGDVVAVGAGGTAVRVDASGVEVTQLGAYSLRALYVGENGWSVAAGEGGEVLRSDDAGASWDVADVHMAGTVLGLDVVGED